MISIKLRKSFITIFDRTSIILAVEMGLTCIFSFKFGLYFAALLKFPNAHIDSLWCVISSILVLQATWNESIKAALIRVMGSFFGACIAAFFFSLIGVQLWVYLLAILVAVVTCSLFNILSYSKLAILTISVIYIIHSLDFVNNYWLISLYRFIESTAGVLIALFMVMLFKPICRWLNKAG